MLVVKLNMEPNTNNSDLVASFPPFARLCPRCDGVIYLDVVACPFCGLKQRSTAALLPVGEPSTGAIKSHVEQSCEISNPFGPDA